MKTFLKKFNIKRVPTYIRVRCTIYEIVLITVIIARRADNTFTFVQCVYTAVNKHDNINKTAYAIEIGHIVIIINYMYKTRDGYYKPLDCFITVCRCPLCSTFSVQQQQQQRYGRLKRF